MNQSEMCPRFEKAVDILSKRWVALIVFQLLNGQQRFSEIEAALPNLSGRVLSERLKELETEGVKSSFDRCRQFSRSNRDKSCSSYVSAFSSKVQPVSYGALVSWTVSMYPAVFISSSYGIFNASASFLMVAGFGTPRLPFSIREIPAALTPEYVASWFTVRCLFSRNVRNCFPKLSTVSPPPAVYLYSSMFID